MLASSATGGVQVYEILSYITRKKYTAANYLEQRHGEKTFLLRQWNAA